MHRTLLVALASFLTATASAHAHAHLDKASPGPGSTVAASPREVVLTFTQKLEPAFSSIEVRDAQNRIMSEGKSVVGEGRTEMRVPLKVLRPGTYRVIWRVLSIDTHRSQGEFTFRVGE